MKKKIALAAAAGVVVAGGAATAVWATADRDVTDRGTCGAATYQLQAEVDDDVWEASFEVRSAGPGEAWTIRLDQGEQVLLDGERTTDDEGEIDADVYLERGTTGPLTANATGPQGETCAAGISLG